MPRESDQDNHSRGGAMASAEEKIACLLALMFVKDLPVQEQVGWLNVAGFGNSEIARLLGIKYNHVNVALHKFRKQPRTRKSLEE